MSDSEKKHPLTNLNVILKACDEVLQIRSSKEDPEEGQARCVGKRISDSLLFLNELMVGADALADIMLKSDPSAALVDSIGQSSATDGSKKTTLEAAPQDNKAATVHMMQKIANEAAVVDYGGDISAPDDQSHTDSKFNLNKEEKARRDEKKHGRQNCYSNINLDDLKIGQSSATALALHRNFIVV